MSVSATEHIFTCNLCEALCGLRVTLDGDRVTRIKGNADDVLSKGHVCPKAFALGELYGDPDRLRAPMRRTKAGWERAEWDDALDDIAANLRRIRAKHGRNAVALYVGNPAVHSHRSSLAAQLLTTAIGTKNRYDANSQDSNPRLFACMQMYGDALSMAVPDIDRTSYLLVIGANPAASNGSQMALGDVKGRFTAVRARGGKVVLIDPRRTETAAWADEHHFIRPGGDAALLCAMLHVLFEERRVDADRVDGIASERQTLRRVVAPYTPERVAPAIGIDAATIRRLAREVAEAPSACVYSRVGTCQNEFGPLVCWLVEALNAVTGNFDREGGLMFPAPAADVGPLGRLLIGNRWGRWRSRVRGLPEFLGALPSAVLSEEMETEGAGQVRAFVCFAGNPVLSTPNGERLARALASLDFMVAIDLYVNETSRHANYVLPPLHVFETGNFDLVLGRFSVRNTAKYSLPIAEPKPGERDDWQIASELALRLAMPEADGLRRALAKRLQKLPEKVVDVLLRAGPYRTTLAKLGSETNGVDYGPLEPSHGKNVRTSNGRICLAPAVFVADLPRLAKWVDVRTDGGLVLIGRRHVRSNNSWMHNTPSLAKGPDRARLLMNKGDAARLGLEDGATVRVRSRVGEVTVALVATDEVMPGVVSLPHGFGHAAAADTLRVAGKLPGPNANALTDELLVEPIIGTSILNGVPVTVEAM